MKERKNVFAKETVTVCDKCSGHMMYKGGGCYVCESCGVPIRSGKYCNLCQSRMAGKASGEKGVYNAVADGTIDKQKGQMRFK